MKKFAKMSLVAAVAVAGFTSYSSASSLEEAVKNTDISGYLRYRIETRHATEKSETRNRLKYVFKTKTKVNDYVTANTKFSGETYNQNNAIQMTFGYFTYANQGLTVSVGRQGLVSPLTDNGNPGDGIVSTYSLGPVTLAGAYYTSIGNNGYDYTAANNTNALQYSRSGSTGSGIDHYGVGVLGSFDPVNFQAWYLATKNGINNDVDANYGTAGDAAETPVTNVGSAEAFALQADAQLGPVGLYVFYSELNLDQDINVDDEISFFNAQISGKIGPVSLSLDYVATGDDSGDTTLDGDSDAQANAGLYVIDTYNYADADFLIAKVSGNVTDSINLELAYLNGEGKEDLSLNTSKGNDDVEETRLSAKYTMSKNFTVTGIYSFGEDETGVTTVGNDDEFRTSRIELKYTF